AGDEVIVPDRTWIATAHAVMMTGARVRLCDVTQNTGLLHVEPKHLKDLSAIIPVHLNGRFAPMWAIGVPHIEDSCQNFPVP
ncbi:DegT/DnrJ/EryC1/StrS family aminotransferase, partial [Listeria monocytogenes]|uniref:DegT/DnrJ/EryC1/StrS family aminotransferase n=1 Tax=Listeria monocytogenes TaxID=1639 RepID=UPI002FDC182C